MNDKGHDGEPEDPSVIDGIVGKRINLENFIDPRSLNDEELQSESKEERNPKERILIFEDVDEGLLGVGHPKHVEELGEGENAEGHGLSNLEMDFIFEVDLYRI